ncbi:MAG: pyruvoyl-dependent arginine decarboxylase [Candidatus Saccharibacteria bacterium]|nr:pyruvoyl-dependent arginine decarboxylase [Candidatus Saccharibacteria bacterium]
MKIYVAGSLGWGVTELSAFDHALNLSGVANYNLIRLSSVMPPNSEIIETKKITDIPGAWGDRLYVVYAEMRTSTAGEQAWAGIGWVQDEVTGSGLFVEHEGKSETKVRSDIESSLKGLLKNRNLPDMEIHMSVVGGECIDQPICALVTAVFQASDWQNTAFTL